MNPLQIEAILYNQSLFLEFNQNYLFNPPALIHVNAIASRAFPDPQILQCKLDSKIEQIKFHVIDIAKTIPSSQK